MFKIFYVQNTFHFKKTKNYYNYLYLILLIYFDFNHYFHNLFYSQELYRVFELSV